MPPKFGLVGVVFGLRSLAKVDMRCRADCLEVKRLVLVEVTAGEGALCTLEFLVALCQNYFSK